MQLLMRNNEVTSADLYPVHAVRSDWDRDPNSDTAVRLHGTLVH